MERSEINHSAELNTEPKGRSALSLVLIGGADGSRTRDLHNAIVTCSQLHHSPICGFLV